jgi:hypothetical protein
LLFLTKLSLIVQNTPDDRIFVVQGSAQHPLQHCCTHPWFLVCHGSHLDTHHHPVVDTVINAKHHTRQQDALSLAQPVLEKPQANTGSDGQNSAAAKVVLPVIVTLQQMVEHSWLCPTSLSYPATTTALLSRPRLGACCWQPKQMRRRSQQEQRPRREQLQHQLGVLLLQPQVVQTLLWLAQQSGHCC